MTHITCPNCLDEVETLVVNPVDSVCCGPGGHVFSSTPMDRQERAKLLAIGYQTQVVK